MSACCKCSSYETCLEIWVTRCPKLVGISCNAGSWLWLWHNTSVHDRSVFRLAFAYWNGEPLIHVLGRDLERSISEL